MNKMDSTEQYKEILLTLFKDFFDEEDYATIEKNESFFKVINDSLTVTELKTLIEDTLGIEGQTPNTFLFDFDTLDKLAQYLFDLSQGKHETQKTEENNDLKASEARTVSYAQERLYFLSRYQSQTGDSYNIQLPVIVHKNLDMTILEKALRQLLDKQDILKAVFISDKGKLRIEHQQKMALPLQEHDFSKLSGASLTDALHELIETSMRRRFALEKEPLWTLDVVRIEGDAVFLLVNMHHLISDYQSLVLFIQLLLKYYQCIEQGASSLSLQPACQYEEFIISEEKALNERTLPEHIDFWKDYLQNREASVFETPPASSNIVNKQFDISQLLDTLTGISEHHKTTYFNVLLSVFMTSINQLLQWRDITIGLPVANRNNRLFEKTIGFFAIPLPFRTILEEGDRFDDLVKRNQYSLNQVLNHILPIEQINALNTTKQPLFQIMFDFLKLPDLEFDGQHPVDYYQELKLFPLTDQEMFVFVLHQKDKLSVNMTYKASPMLEQFTERLPDIFCEFVQSIAAHPDQILLHKQEEPVQVKGIAVAATFTADPVDEPLQFWLNEFSMKNPVRFAPYHQIFQQLLDPQSLFHEDNLANIILIRPVDWIRDKSETTDKKLIEHLQQTYREFMDAVSAFVQRSNIPMIVAICPADVSAYGEKVKTELKNLETNLFEALSNIKGVKTINAEAEINSKFHLSPMYQEHLDRTAHVPYAQDYFIALASVMFRVVFNLFQKGFKVIAVDCDNTLWHGVVGEDGIDGIGIQTSHKVLQQFLKDQKDRGMLICLCSKNEEQDVRKVFSTRDDMILSAEDITAWKVNWNPKSQNLMDLQDDLNLFMDSFIMLDDSPMECEEIRQSCPGVLTLQVPEPSENMEHYLNHVWAFKENQATTEDALRTRFYQSDIQRSQLKRSSQDLRNFIESIELKVLIEPLQPEHEPRVSQLSFRTSQFNTSGIQLSESELRSVKEEIFTVTVSDKFGDYGLVGYLVCDNTSDKYLISSMVLSCRSLSRGVEHEMLRHAAKRAEELGLKQIEINFKPTERNTPARTFLESLPKGEAPYQYFVRDLINLNYLDQKLKNDSQEKKSTAANPDEKKQFSHSKFVDIVNNLHSVELIKKRLKGRPDSNQSENEAIPESHNHIINALKNYWQELLKVDAIDKNDNFYELGGTSLKLLQSLEFIQQEFGIEYPFSHILEHPVLSEIAAEIARMTENKENETGVINAAPSSSRQSLQLRMLEDVELSYTDVPIIQQAAPVRSALDAKAILLTGATGFVGIHVLATLLSRTHADVYCLVRAKTLEDARHRLDKTAETFHLSAIIAEKKRIKLVLGALEDPTFALNQREYEQLSNQVDLIYHVGAKVNFVEAYEAFVQANISGLKNILKFAAAGKTKITHFVSSIGVYNGHSYLHVPEILEVTLSDSLGHELPTGYQQSKWVGERIVSRAIERGLEIVVYRPGTITGSSKTQATNNKDMVTNLISTVYSMRLLPKMRNLDFVPVDLVADAIVEISCQPEQVGKTFNIVNPNVMRAEKLLELYQWSGIHMELVSMDGWKKKYQEYFNEQGRSDLQFFNEIIFNPERKYNFFDLSLTIPPINCDNLVSALKGTSVVIPEINLDLLGHYFDVFQKIGLLPKNETMEDIEVGYAVKIPEIYRGFAMKSAQKEGDGAVWIDRELEKGRLTTPIRLLTESFVTNYKQLMDTDTLTIKGELVCELLSPTALRIKAGTIQFLPHRLKCYDQQGRREFMLLQATAVDASGKSYQIEGKKFLKDYNNLLNEMTTLHVNIRSKDALGDVSVTAVIGFSINQFFDEQIKQMDFKKSMSQADININRGIWIGYLVKQALIAYLAINSKEEKLSIRQLLTFIHENKLIHYASLLQQSNGLFSSLMKNKIVMNVLINYLRSAVK